MSALDKLLGVRKSAPASVDDSNPLAGLFSGPLGGMLSSIISPSQIEKMGGEIAGMLDFFKSHVEMSVAQNVVIIAQNNEIIARLQAMGSLPAPLETEQMQEQTTDEISTVEGLGSGVLEHVAGGGDSGAGSGTPGAGDSEPARRRRARKPAGSGAV